MKYTRFEHIRRDTSELPDYTVFTTFKEATGEWALGMKFRNQFTLTRFQSQNVDKRGVEQVWKQIRFCKTYGWTYRGGKAFNTEVDEMETEFQCIYCGKTTFDTSQPCTCREKTTEQMLKKTPSGIILPI